MKAEAEVWGLFFGLGIFLLAILWKLDTLCNKLDEIIELLRER